MNRDIDVMKGLLDSSGTKYREEDCIITEDRYIEHEGIKVDIGYKTSEGISLIIGNETWAWTEMQFFKQDGKLHWIHVCE